METALNPRDLGATRNAQARAAFQLDRGKSAPLGASVWEGGVNFSVFSKNATQIDLLLFHRPLHIKSKLCV